MIQYADSYGILSLFLVLIGGLAFLALLTWLGRVLGDRRVPDHSPYSTLPTRRWYELSFATIGKIYLYFRSLHQYDNSMFNIRRALVCRETGRVFPNAVDWLGRMHLDWTFLNKRYPGHWVSWGSLSERQQRAVREAHHTLVGFQTELSSPEPSPRAIERRYALARPGPLYVDPVTLVLLGWKIIPGTELEVLIVQKPKKIRYPNPRNDQAAS